MGKSIQYFVFVISIICNSHQISAQLTNGFPQSMSFKVFDTLRVSSPEFQAVLDQNVNATWIHGVKTEPRVVNIKKRYPNKIVTIQDAWGGIDQNLSGTVWPGHLLYKVRTALTSSISATDTILQVVSRSYMPKDSAALANKNKEFPFTLTIYALDSVGNPDWAKCEHVHIKSITNDKIVIERGQWGTTPLAFDAGKAVVATHMMFWSGQWMLNFSVHCPRGGVDNLNAQEWFARFIADRLNGSLADGVEFDVGRWTWGSPVSNPMDVNNDGIADYGFINGVNSFGIGGQLFLKELRQLLGPNKFIQADSNSALHGVRGWKYLNGVQMESFPDANKFDLFCEAFQHLRMWSENAEATPRVSYPFTKTATTVYGNSLMPDGGKTDFHFRIGLASACLVGMPHPFASIENINFDPENPKSEDSSVYGVFEWDEYHGGDLNNYQWLGNPVSAAKRDSSTDVLPSLIENTNWQWSVKPEFVANNSQSVNSYTSNVQTLPEGVLPDSLWFGVKLVPKTGTVLNVVAGQEYTIEFEARGDDSWQYLGQRFDKLPRMISVQGFLPAETSPLTVLVDSTWRKYKLSFVALATGPITPSFGVSEQIGSTTINNIKIISSASERWSREFENGLVLLNMGHTPWAVDLQNGAYRYLRGTQDSLINSGKTVGSRMSVPAQDAVFLVKNKLTNIFVNPDLSSARLIDTKSDICIENLKIGSELSFWDVSGKKLVMKRAGSKLMRISKSILPSHGVYIISVIDMNNMNVHFKVML